MFRESFPPTPPNVSPGAQFKAYADRVTESQEGAPQAVLAFL